MTTAFATATTVDEALAALAGGARPVAGGTDLVVGARQGKAPLPESLVAIHRIDELTRHRGGGRRPPDRRARHARRARRAPGVRERFTALADACAIVGSHATRAQGTLGGNLMNASPAMETGGPLMCLDAIGDACAPRRGKRTVPVADLFTGPGATVADAGRAARRGRRARAGARERAALRPARVPAADGDRRRRRDRGRRRSTATRVERRARRDHGPRPHDPPRPGGRGGSRRSTGDDGAVAAAARAAAEAAAPISDVRASERYRRAMAEVIARRAIDSALARARGEHVPIPASGGGA